MRRTARLDAVFRARVRDKLCTDCCGLATVDVDVEVDVDFDFDSKVVRVELLLFFRLI